MEETASTPNEPPPEATSVGAKLVNVFATPGLVFAEVQRRPFSAANWLVPIFILALTGMLYSLVVFSQDAIVQQFHDLQSKELQKKVTEGTMKQADVDKIKGTMESFGPIIAKVGGVVGALIGSFIWAFMAAGVIWLLGRFLFKVHFGYNKALEVAGLAGMISALGYLVTLLLVVGMGTLYATPSLALAIRDFDASNKLHLALGAINLFNLWLLGILAVGLAKLSRVSFVDAALWLFGLSILFKALLILGGGGSFAL